ncbi:MAG: hypothetical protein KAS71_16680, partial [Bacteroidales bacterium]|nr:hypothetical protein [Bacteroidales bacterium]
AGRLHFILSFVKPLVFIAGLFSLPVESFPWKFVMSYCLALGLGKLVLILCSTKGNAEFLLTPFMILKLSVWMMVMVSQTTIYPGLVLLSTDRLFAFIIILLLFLDMILDLIFRIFSFYRKLHFPLLKQPIIVQNLFGEGYQNYLDIPIWSTLYPFIRSLI